jgi:hypothetical protein
MSLENNLHQVARSFMASVATESMDQNQSLDEFLIEYKAELSDEQRKLGWEICDLFEAIY